MKKSISALFFGLLLSSGLYAQHTEIRFGPNGITGVPSQVNYGDTIDLLFELKNSGDIGFNDTIELWTAGVDSTGQLIPSSVKLRKLLVDSINSGDSLAFDLELEIDPLYFAPGVNITVVWPLLDIPGTYTTESKRIEINVIDNGSSIKELAEWEYLQLDVYPNPAEHTLFIDTDLNWNQEWLVQAISIEGRVIKLSQTRNEIDLSPLAKGTYILRLSNKNEEYFARIVKN